MLLFSCADVVRHSVLAVTSDWRVKVNQTSQSLSKMQAGCCLKATAVHDGAWGKAFAWGSAAGVRSMIGVGCVLGRMKYSPKEVDKS